MNRFFTLLFAAYCLTAVGQSEYCLEGTVWDDELGGCVSVILNSADINNDGCVQLSDLLDLLTAYGDCGDEESALQCGDPLEYQGYEYGTVQIGEQCWFAENLRAENYRDGTPISNDLTQWESATFGITVVLDNDDTNLEATGRLYNLNAVVYPGGLCPAGWRVSSFEDWDLLRTEVAPIIGGWPNEAQSGRVLKNSPSDQPPWDGTNDFGFNAYKGGASFNGGFYEQDRAQWWTSTLNQYGWGIKCQMAEGDDGVGLYENGFDNPDTFYNVRCIKDSE